MHRAVRRVVEIGRVVVVPQLLLLVAANRTSFKILFFEEFASAVLLGISALAGTRGIQNWKRSLATEGLL